MRRETEFRQQCCRNCKKIHCVKGERKLHFGNEIIEILVLPVLTEMETNCGNGIAKIGRKKKKNCGNQVAENDGKKKMLSLQHFYIIFTANYRWLVVIGSNLKLTLRLLFCLNNNNQ